MKTGVIIQARMGSTRLSGKVMLNLCGKPVLWHDIERIKQCKMVDTIIIATTTNENDNIIYKKALEYRTKVFCGSENDVLERYYLAAKENKLDMVVRITSDCPLIDPYVTDEIIAFYKNNNYELVTNAGSEESRTYPRGLDTEVFSFKALENTYNNTKQQYQREHVTPYLYENYEVYYYKNNIDYSKYRWTLDTEEDYSLIKKIYNNLYRGKHDFYMKDIIELMKKNNDLNRINSHIEQKKI